jgi:hypothetical protein
VIAVQLLQLRWLFTRASWNAVVESTTLRHGQAYGLVVLAEETVMMLALVGSILVAVTFFKRRRSFRHLFAAYTIPMLAWVIVDEVLVAVLDKWKQPLAVVPQLVIAGLFVRYVLTSPQAKRTFTRP